ncbi:DUF364 domain-containing protein [bacterium]|nr:DUF364 domain-containing protein [bacterium]
MNFLPEVISGLVDGEVERISVGSHWTAVVVSQNGARRCGLASNPIKGFQADDEFQKTLAAYEKQTALALCDLALQENAPFTSIGVAAINALLPLQPESWVDRNAGEVLAQKGKGKRVALVGHFPFVPELREQVGHLDVLELRPREGDTPASEAPRVIPQADVVAITSMAFVNGTMQGLLDLCLPETYLVVLGPSTPLSPILFDKGINMLCGSIVETIDPVVEGVEDGKSFRQFKSQGVRLVTIEQ